MTRLDFGLDSNSTPDIAGRDSGHLTRLDSARLSSAGYSGFDSSPLLAQAQLWAPDLDWGINSMLDSLSSEFGSEIGLGLATRDLVWLGSEESELSSAHLDRSIVRPIWSRFISVRKLLYLKEIREILHKRKSVGQKNGQNCKCVNEKPRTKKT